MTAGSGIIHSEIPKQGEGRMKGFQLWLNLPAAEKMRTPWYRDFKAEELPRLTTTEGVAVTVIAGQSPGVTGAVTHDGTAGFDGVRIEAGEDAKLLMIAGRPLKEPIAQ